MKKLTIVLLSFFCLTPASAGDWPMGRKNSARTGSSSEVARPPLTHKWTSAPLAGGARFISSPAVARGVVYIGGEDNTVQAFNAYTGELLWSYATAGFVDATPAISSTTLYTNSYDGNLYALNTENGALRWKSATGGRDMSSPAVTRQALCVGSGFPQTSILSINALTGALRWRRDTDQYVYATFACSSSLVAGGSNDGKFYFLNPATGADLFTPYATTGRIYFSATAVANGSIYGVSGDNQKKLYAFSAATGQLQWSAALPVTSCESLSSPAVTSSGVYVAASCTYNSKTQLFAFDLITGAAKTGFTTYQAAFNGAAKEYGFASSPAIAGGVIYMAAADGKLHFIDEASGGAIEAPLQVGAGQPLLASPAVANGWIYIASFDGKIYAYQADKIAAISSPSDVDELARSAPVLISGVLKPSAAEGLTSYSLEYGSTTAPSSWTFIAQNQTADVVDGSIISLGTWTVAGLGDGDYVLRLTAEFTDEIRTVLHPIKLYNKYASGLFLAAGKIHLATGDGTELSLPEESLSQDDTLSISIPASYPSTGVPSGMAPTGIVREILLGSTSTVLLRPATLRIPYQLSDIAGFEPKRLRIATYDNAKGAWVSINGSKVDTQAQGVTAEVNHFSLFQLIAYAPSASALIVEDRTYVTPNPAKGDAVTFKVFLNDDAEIKIQIFTIAGLKVGEIAGQGLGGNVALIPWNMARLASGIYIYKVEASSGLETRSVTKKMAVIH